MAQRPNLIYTVALDPPEYGGAHTLAKILVSSLLKTYFQGDILVFKNSPEPLFKVPRAGVYEINVPNQKIEGYEGTQHSWTWKYRAREYIDPSAYEKIMFIDGDCLALRNLDHLFKGDWDISYHVEEGIKIQGGQFHCFLTDEEMKSLDRDGVNSGNLIVRGEHFNEVMKEWERIDQGPTTRPRNCSDQASWNRLLLNTQLKTKPFEKEEIQMPIYLNPDWKENREAALLHILGVPLSEKIPYAFGRYMETFYCDDSALFFHILEM